MTKQLYEEALADVKKLKEVAEDNAKRALLEAVTPRIRDLIENQLLGEDSEEDDKLLMDDVPEDLAGMDSVVLPAEPVPGVGDAAASADAISMPDEEGKVTLDLSALKVPGTEEYEISMESAKALGALIDAGKSREKVFEAKLRHLDRKVKSAVAASQVVKESKGYSDALSSIISEVEDTYSYLQNHFAKSPMRKSYASLLESYITTLKKLMEQKMNRNFKTLSEADVTLKLTGMPDDVDLDDIGVDLITGGEGGEEEESDEGGEEEELDLGGDEEESEGEEEELDLGEEGDEESEDEESEEKMESRRLSDDVIVEIDEGMLRREISRMKALREAAEDVQTWGHGAGEVSDEFEDDDMGDPFVDVDLTTEGHDDKDEAEVEEGMYELDQAKDDAKDEAEVEKEADMDELDELDQAMKQEADMDELDQAEDTEEMGGVRDEAQSQKQSRQPGATVESLRRRLAAEARLQAEAKQKAQGAKKQAQQKQKEAKQKQTEAQKQKQEAQQKQKQGKQKEAQQKQKEAQQKQKEAQQKQKEAKKMQEAYVFYATKFNESVARSSKLRGVLAEATRRGSALNGASERSAAETNDLRTKLAETNLFNAKLLFTNKLLQNEALTKRQKAEVIERLDEARNEREVKLVYESLVKTLQGSPAKLTESAERGVIGSSSRPARPASATNTLNEGFEADRWARLAGIVK